MFFDEMRQGYVPTNKDFENLLAKYDELKQENERLYKMLNERILLVEDGSVDTDKLEDDGFYVIAYRQGAAPPMWLEKQNKVEGK